MPPIQRNHHQGNRSQGISRMAAQPAHGRRPTSHQQRGGHHQLHPARTRTAAPLLRPRQSVRRQNRGAYMSRRDEVHHARRHRTHAERLRPDDMRRREANVHSRSIRRHGQRRNGIHHRRLHRKRLFQPDTREAHRTPPRPEHRCVVPLRARHRPRHNGLRRKAGRSADQGACRRRDMRRCERLIS